MNSKKNQVRTICIDTKGLIAFLMIVLVSFFIGCSTASAQSLTPDEVRTILKLESSYRACLEENSILSRKETSYSRLVKIREAQIKNYEQILNNQAEVELNLQGTIIEQNKVMKDQARKVRLFKTGMFIAVGIIPFALVAGAIYSPL